MRLIDAPIGIFRFDGELVLKTEYYSKDKQSGKYIPDCYIIRTGEYFWGSAKTANELINLDIEPVDFAELLPTVTDIISRQAAIDEANAWLLDCLKVNKQDRSCGLIRRLEDLPSVQPVIVPCDYVKACNAATIDELTSAVLYLDVLEELKKHGYVLVDMREVTK